MPKRKKKRPGTAENPEVPFSQTVLPLLKVLEEKWSVRRQEKKKSEKRGVAGE